MKMKYIPVFCAALMSMAMSCKETPEDQSPVKVDDKYNTMTLQNPVIRNNCADPSIIDDRERTGYFYLYSTQNGESGTAGVVYLPVYRSKDLINWSLVGNAFGEDRPQWVPNTRVWAPDINYIDGKYVLYYSLGDWNTPSNSACGVAFSDSPEGPFKDRGMLVDYATQGVSNSIDANFFDDGDAKYLFWGSFGQDSGIWAIELSDDGLSLKPGAKKKYICGHNFEGTYVHKRDGYYYLFASMGACCSGKESTYHVVVGRSENVLGPYYDPDGNPMDNDNYSYTILSNPTDNAFAGTGHNAEIVTDDAGQDWMPYHAYWEGNNYNGRCLNIDQVRWVGGWPMFMSGHPTVKGSGPKWNKEQTL